MKERDTSKSLTLKQLKFVDFYCGTCNGNATKAAREAGYEQPQMQGPRMMKNDAIREAVTTLYREKCMGPDETLARLGAMARSSIEDVLTTTGQLDLDQAKASGAIHLIKKVTYTDEGGLKSVEMYDAQSALDKIAKAHKLYDNAAEHDVDIKVTVEYERPAADNPAAPSGADPGSF